MKRIYSPVMEKFGEGKFPGECEKVINFISIEEHRGFNSAPRRRARETKFKGPTLATFHLREEG